MTCKKLLFACLTIFRVSHPHSSGDGRVKFHGVISSLFQYYGVSYHIHEADLTKFIMYSVVDGLSLIGHELIMPCSVVIKLRWNYPIKYCIRTHTRSWSHQQPLFCVWSITFSKWNSQRAPTDESRWGVGRGWGTRPRPPLHWHGATQKIVVFWQWEKLIFQGAGSGVRFIFHVYLGDHRVMGAPGWLRCNEKKLFIRHHEASSPCRKEQTEHPPLKTSCLIMACTGRCAWEESLGGVRYFLLCSELLNHEGIFGSKTSSGGVWNTPSLTTLRKLGLATEAFHATYSADWGRRIPSSRLAWANEWIQDQ